MNESIVYGSLQLWVRACAMCPGEVATPILDNRPIPVPDEERARMVQAEDWRGNSLLGAPESCMY